MMKGRLDCKGTVNSWANKNAEKEGGTHKNTMRKKE
jgi:hypothetical protein